ncbi:MAG: DUF86 domain-containing protein [Thermodesulfobacteriota bacterium]
MIDKKLVEKKIRRIEGFLRELKQVTISTFEEFQKNTVIKRFVERNIELAIEQMTDICRHLVAELDLPEPETYADCFDILAQNKVIPNKDADTFKAMVRFRNVLIHIYDGIDDSITYGVYKKHLKDFKKFAEIIRAFLNPIS